MASLQQKLNPILVNNVIGYHALDPPVSGPHELHERGLVVLPLPLQAVEDEYIFQSFDILVSPTSPWVGTCRSRARG